jgi:hypothetical protein
MIRVLPKVLPKQTLNKKSPTSKTSKVLKVKLLKWWVLRDSNSRPLGYEGNFIYSIKFYHIIS